MNIKQAIGIDLGGTKIDLALVDEKGVIQKPIRIQTNVKGGALAIEKQILDVIEDLVNSTRYSLEGVGIGVAGQIDDADGTVLFGPNLNWINHPLQSNIQKALNLPVKVINDVRAIGWGEWIYGAAKGCNDFVCVLVGTGVGGAIVRNGQMQNGCSNTCGEIGHMTIDFDGRLCSCGNRGCLEAYTGGWAIAEQARDMLTSDNQSSKLILELADNDINMITAKTVIDAYRQKDKLATHIMETFCRALAAGCVSIVNAWNPGRIILGGGLLCRVPEFIPVIEASIRTSALKSAIKKLEIVPSQLYEEGRGVLGAAAIIFHQNS